VPCYYLVTDLGTLVGGASSMASGLNDKEQVVGPSQVAGGSSHTFRWDSATGMQDLRTLPAESSSGASSMTLVAYLQANMVLPAGPARLMRFCGPRPEARRIWELYQATIQAQRLR
jgi:probable HAF family extracellular repeat protein